jgi:hypothetical protein
MTLLQSPSHPRLPSFLYFNLIPNSITQVNNLATYDHSIDIREVMWITWITSLAFPFVSHSVDRSKPVTSWLLAVLVGAGTVLVVDAVSATKYPGFPFAHRGVDKTGLQM